MQKIRHNRAGQGLLAVAFHDKFAVRLRLVRLNRQSQPGQRLVCKGGFR